jgi:hypothetical protein
VKNFLAFGVLLALSAKWRTRRRTRTAERPWRICSRCGTGSLRNWPRAMRRDGRSPGTLYQDAGSDAEFERAVTQECDRALSPLAPVWENRSRGSPRRSVYDRHGAEPAFPHRRLTRPFAPITKVGQPHSQSYVVCLDCGKQFEYDLNEMRIGKALDHSHDASVVPPNMPKARKTKVKYALLAAVPAAVVLGVVMKGRKKAVKPDSKANPAAGDESGRREE